MIAAWLRAGVSRDRCQFELLLELDELLVDVLVLLDELVPVLLCESVSVEHEPFEQLVERDLDELVDFETLEDLLPTRIGTTLKFVKPPGARGNCAACAGPKTIAAPNKTVTTAYLPRRDIAYPPIRRRSRAAADQAFDHLILRA